VGSLAELMEEEGQKLRSMPIPTRVARRRG
jgi:hypothetical protein